MNISIIKIARRAAFAVAAIAAGPLFAQAESGTTTSPAKIYASVGGALSFTVNYAGAETSQTDLLVTQTANTSSPVLTVFRGAGNCVSPTTPPGYVPPTPANALYALWEPTGSFPANCGAAAASTPMATFTGTVASFPGAGSYVIEVLNNAAGGSTNVTTNDVTVCQKRTVSSVTASPATEGAVITYTVNFDSAVAVGCGGFAVPGVLSGTATAAPDSVVLLTTGTCANVADSATSCTILAQGADDTAVDGTKVATLTITDSTAASNYVSVGKTVSANVLDNESSIAVALGRNGAEGGNTVQFVVTCNGPGTNVTVNYAWSGSATAADFTAALPTSTTFAACNGATQTVDLAVVDDTLIEGAENATLTISTPTANVALVPGQAAATASIADNDALPSVAITKGADCAEPATNCAFTVTVTSNTSPVQTGAVNGVSLTLGGTATPGAGNDYTIRKDACDGTELATTKSTFTTNLLNVGANTVVVCVIDDLAPEGTETVTLQVNTNANATATTTSAVSLNITDDDGPQTVSVASSGSPAEQGTTTGTFTLTRAGGSGPAQLAALTVNVTLGGTATFGTTCAAGVDYMLAVVGPATASLATAPRTVTFPAGNPAVLTAAITVTPCDDTVTDAGETVTLTVAPTTANPASDYAPANAPANVASLTIADNEVAVTVTPSGVTEGGSVTFTVACTPAGATVTGLIFAVTGADAGQSPSPAGPALGTLTCGTPIVVTVPTVDDKLINPRSLSFTLTGPGAASTGGTVILPTSAAIASVVDNDQPVNVPTMGMFGLGFMSLLVAGFAAFQRRRVQK